MRINKSDLFVVISAVMIGFIFSFLYSRVVISYPQERLNEFKRSVRINDGAARQDLRLSPDAYLLRIRHFVRGDYSKEILVNGVQVSPNIPPYVIRRGDYEVSYIHLSPRSIKDGKNALEVNFSGKSPESLDISLFNYRQKIGEDIYILFSDSSLFSRNFFFTAIIFIASFLFLLYLMPSWFLRKILPLSLNKLVLYQIYSLLPFFIVLVSLLAVPRISSFYKIGVSPAFFFALGALSSLFSYFCIVAAKLWKVYEAEKLLVSGQRTGAVPATSKLYGVCEVIANNPAKSAVFELVKAMKLRSFSDKCILSFLAFLIICAFLLLLRMYYFAEKTADLAYFALCLGMAIKFFRSIGEKGGSDAC